MLIFSSSWLRFSVDLSVANKSPCGSELYRGTQDNGFNAPIDRVRSQWQVLVVSCDLIGSATILSTIIWQTFTHARLIEPHSVVNVNSLWTGALNFGYAVV